VLESPNHAWSLPMILFNSPSGVEDEDRDRRDRNRRDDRGDVEGRAEERAPRSLALMTSASRSPSAISSGTTRSANSKVFRMRTMEHLVVIEALVVLQAGGRARGLSEDPHSKKLM
jgi:hypothetical protein